MKVNMLRQTGWLTIVIAAIISPQTTCAEEDILVEIGDSWYELTSDNEAHFISRFYLDGTHYPEDYDLVIPPSVEYEGEIYEVTEIKDLAFYSGGCRQLLYSLEDEPIASLSIPATIEKLGELVSSWMPRLKSITVDPENRKFRSVDGVLYTLDDDGALYCLQLYPKNKQETNFVIPEGVRRVTSSDDFDGAPITTLYIPSTIYSLGHLTSSYLPELTSITVHPENITYGAVDDVLYFHNIENDCLDWLVLYPQNKSGSHFDVPEGVLGIRDGAFRYSSLTHINFPSSLQSIGGCAFNGLHLDEIVLPDDTYLTGYEFYGLTCFTPIVIPKSMQDTGEGYFAESTGLMDVILPEHITKIGKKWFYGARAETFHIQPHITRICEDAFSNAEMRYIDIPDGVKTIEPNAFEDCDSLLEVTLPLGITMLDDNVFRGCDNLRSVTVKKDTWVIYQAFRGCSSLSDMYMLRKRPPELDDNYPLGLGESDYCPDRLGQITVHVMRGCGEAYRNSLWAKVGPIVEDLTEDGVDEMPDDGQIASDERCIVYTVQGTIAADAIAYGELKKVLPSGVYIIRTTSGKTEKISI